MSNSSEHITIIRPKSSIFDIDWMELWRFRELFFFLVWRDVKVKYKQSALGALWAIIVPFVQMVIFTLLFANVAKLPTDGIHPQIFYYSGLLIWTYFATALTFSSNSLVQSKNILTKIYFPRLIMPSAPAVAALVDFAIAFIILIAMMIYYQTAISVSVLLIPYFIFMAMFTAIGTGLLFSALNVKYRDIGFALPFITQIWMYGTVIVPYSKIPDAWGILKTIYMLNPMAASVEGFRWSMLHLNLKTTKMINNHIVTLPVEFPWELIGLGTISMIFIFILGLWYFRKMEDTFADIV